MPHQIPSHGSDPLSHAGLFLGNSTSPRSPSNGTLRSRFLFYFVDSSMAYSQALAAFFSSQHRPLRRTLGLARTHVVESGGVIQRRHIPSSPVNPREASFLRVFFFAPTRFSSLSHRLSIWSRSAQSALCSVSTHRFRLLRSRLAIRVQRVPHHRRQHAVPPLPQSLRLLA